MVYFYFILISCNTHYHCDQTYLSTWHQCQAEAWRLVCWGTQMTGYLGLLWMYSTLKGHSINKMSNSVYSHTQRGNRTFLFSFWLLNSVTTLKMGHGQWNNCESVKVNSGYYHAQFEWFCINRILIIQTASMFSHRQVSHQLFALNFFYSRLILPQLHHAVIWMI